MGKTQLRTKDCHTNSGTDCSPVKKCCFASVLIIWKQCCRCKPGNFTSRGWKSLLPSLFFLSCADESSVNINTALRNLLFISHLSRAQALHRFMLPLNIPGAGEKGNISFPITWSPVFFPSNYIALLLIGYSTVGFKLIKGTKHISQRQGELNSYFWTHNRAIGFPGGKSHVIKLEGWMLPVLLMHVWLEHRPLQ